MTPIGKKENVMSKTFCPYSITAAMNSLGRSWLATNKEQYAFMHKLYFPDEAQGIEGLRSLSARDAESLNSELASAGFDLRCPSFGTNGIGLLGILVLKLLWQKLETSVKPILAENGRWYRGAQLEHGENWVSAYISKGHPSPICSWQADDNLWTFYITEAYEPLGGMLLLSYIISLLRDASQECGGVRFPIASLVDHPDISWLRGMVHDNLHVDEALQENRLLLDEKGVEIKSATVLLVVSASCAAGPTLPIYKIKRPYFFWATRVGCSVPVFAAYVDYDALTIDNQKEQGLEKEIERKREEQLGIDRNRAAVFGYRQ